MTASMRVLSLAELKAALKEHWMVGSRVQNLVKTRAGCLG